MLALGAFVAAAVGSVNPEAWAVESRLAVRGSSMLAFSIFINLKFLVVDVDQISLEWHALSRPIQYRVFWRLFQPILILTIVAASAGLDSLLTEIAPAIDSDSSRVVFGRRTAFFSTAVFFLALVFQVLDLVICLLNNCLRLTLSLFIPQPAHFPPLDTDTRW